MGKLQFAKFFWMVGTFTMATTIGLSAQTFHSETIDGTPSHGPLIQSNDGNLYGTTSNDGTHGYGNVFRIIMPGPLLTCTQSGGQLTLSWRTNYVGFTLQFSSGQTSGNWSDCTSPPAVAGGQFIVTNPISGSAGYFRLKR